MSPKGHIAASQSSRLQRRRLHQNHQNHRPNRCAENHLLEVNPHRAYLYHPSRLVTRVGRTVKLTAKAQGNAAFDDFIDDSFANFYAYSANYSQPIPATYKEAQSSPDWPLWEEAIYHELQSHVDNDTWELVNPATTSTANVIGSRWVFALKHKADGSIQRYKARLVAQGFAQVHGIDYFDTYSPVVRYDSLRLILRIASLQNYVVEQMDFDTAYLNSSISEHIYMRPPPGFDIGIEYPED